MIKQLGTIKSAVVASVSFLATAAVAQTPFDGLYFPEGEVGWECVSDAIGMDRGALAVKDGALWGLESYCELTNPTNVRGMGAILYDAVCYGEGSQYSYRVMLMRRDQGIYVIQDGFTASWSACGG